MEIYLNGQRLDYSLESERTLGEVASALSQWLGGSGLCVTGVSADGRRAAGWEALSIESTARLDIVVAPLSEARTAALRTAAEFLGLFRGALERRDGGLLGELAPGYPSVVEGIRSLLSPQPGTELYSRLLELDQLLAGNTPERIVAWGDEMVSRAARAAEDLVAAVSLSLQESDDPAKALPRIRRSLDGSLAEVEEVSVLLQTGRDREAMARVITFSELTASLARILSRLLPVSGAQAGLAVSGRPLPEFQAELNGTLGQLLEAFTARDTVLIGDLLEYEVAPRVRALAEAARRLETGGGEDGPHAR